MLSVNAEVLLDTSEINEEPFFQSGQVLSIQDDLYVVRFENMTLKFHEQDMVTLFCKDGSNFLRQPFEICDVLAPEASSDDEPTVTPVAPAPNHLTFTLKAAGLPSPADQRRYFRLSTVISDLSATVGNKPDCRILDVSMTGFAIKTTAVFSVGQEVNASFVFEGVNYRGSAFVESASTLDCGQHRYGLSCFDTDGGDATLAKGLKGLVTNLQRQQLRRISRSA